MISTCRCREFACSRHTLASPLTPKTPSQLMNGLCWINGASRPPRTASNFCMPNQMKHRNHRPPQQGELQIATGALSATENDSAILFILCFVYIELYLKSPVTSGLPVHHDPSHDDHRLTPLDQTHSAHLSYVSHLSHSLAPKQTHHRCRRYHTDEQ